MRSRSASIPVLAAAAVATSALHAETVDFVVYSDNAASAAGIQTSAQLSATASAFTLTLSNSTSTGYISNFYLENGSATAGLGSATIQNTAGVSFSAGGSPPTPGGGIHTTAGGAWGGNFFSMSVNSPRPNQNAISGGESLTVVFANNGTFSLSDFVLALQNNDIRLVQHYRAFGPDGESAWLSSNFAVVPLPPAAWAGLGLLGVMGAVRTLRRRA